MFLEIFKLFLLFNLISGNELKLSINSLPPLLLLSNSDANLKLSGPIGQFIEQLAQDLNLKILLTDQEEADIFINNSENVDDINKTSLKILYERNYCFIYGNSRKVPASIQMKALFGFESITMCAVPICITYCFYIYLLKTRYGITNQLYSRTCLYALSFHINAASTIYVPIKYWEKLVMFNFALLIFWVNCYVQSAMSRELTVPKYYTTDIPIKNVRTIEELKGFNYGIGLGDLCFQDLLKGLYKQRVCLMDCVDANIAIKNNEAIYLLENAINFKNIIKISNNCLFKDKIQRITKLYIEAGFFEKWFNEMHSLSYK